MKCNELKLIKILGSGELITDSQMSKVRLYLRYRIRESMFENSEIPELILENTVSKIFLDLDGKVSRGFLRGLIIPEYYQLQKLRGLEK